MADLQSLEVRVADLLGLCELLSESSTEIKEDMLICQQGKRIISKTNRNSIKKYQKRGEEEEEEEEEPKKHIRKKIEEEKEEEEKDVIIGINRHQSEEEEEEEEDSRENSGKGSLRSVCIELPVN